MDDGAARTPAAAARKEKESEKSNEYIADNVKQTYFETPMTTGGVESKNDKACRES